jgi:thioredoxin
MLKRQPRCGKCKTLLKISKQPVEVSTSNFDQEVFAWPGIVLVDFWSSRCSHCLRMAPIVEAIAHERAGFIKIVMVNIDKESSIAMRFQVKATPLITLYRNGNKINEISGALPKEQLEAWIESSLPG